jgi:choline kinase
MKALILAAGMGTRLKPLTNDSPKSLITVAGKTIFENQINNLYKNGINEIIIVTGYKADAISNIVNKKFPEVHVIENINYATTNNMYSAYMARTALKDCEFLMMNADVFFDASIIYELLRFNAKNAIVTDFGNFLDESMKVVERDERLVQISKEILKENALGSSIDIYKFSEEGGTAFFNKCAHYIEVLNNNNLWSEVALNDILSEVVFKACPVNGRWIEIDTLADLQEANTLFGDV